MEVIKNIIIDKNLKNKIQNLSKIDLPVEIDLNDIDNFIKSKIPQASNSKKKKRKK